MGPYNFYTEAAVLDAVKEQKDPRRDVVDVVVQALRQRADIRRYFFLNLRNPVWTGLFHELGLFNSLDEDARSLRPDLMHYLFSVAAAVPEVVYDVACQFTPNGYYELYHLLGACRALPAAELASVLHDQLPKWIRHEDSMAGSATAEILDFLINSKDKCGPLSALPALEALLEPVRDSNGTAQCRGELYWFSHKRSAIIERFAEEPIGAMTFLAPMLTRVEDAEAHATQEMGRSTSGSWRTAVEDTDQDNLPELKDILLMLLRDLAQEALRSSVMSPTVASVTETVLQYLQSERAIFVRLGLHLTRMFVDYFRPQVEELLLDAQLYENYEIHHEFFLLLRDCFSEVGPRVQPRVVSVIVSGPSEARLQEMGSLYSEYAQIPIEDAVLQYRECWVRDRLWMIREHLDHETARILQGLVDRFGQPKHPEFTSYISGGWVGDQSPFSIEELLASDPTDVLKRVADWCPEGRAAYLEAPSKEGLAGTLQAVVTAKPADFAQVGPQLLDLRLEAGYITHYLGGLREALKNGGSFAWTPVIELCERLASIPPLKKHVNSNFAEYWNDPLTAHKAVVMLLQDGIASNAGFDTTQSGRVLRLLISLADHPDPDDEADQPKPGFMGHDDPAAVALNHVRPRALDAIIQWCIHWERENNPDGQAGARTLRPDVRVLFESKLSHERETSLAVQSVFGSFFPELVWLDNEFAWAQADRIFPSDEDAYFGAAFGSFIQFNVLRVDLYPSLRARYWTAIIKSQAGGLPGLGHEVLKKVVGHVLLAYALGFEEVPDPSTTTRNIVVDAYAVVPAQAIAGATWFLWNTLKADPRLLSAEYWSRVRNLMTWRLDVLDREGRPPERADEVGWFVGWIDAQPLETLKSAYPLLEMMVPYCSAPLSDRRQQAVFMSTTEFAGSRRSRVAL